MSEFDLLSDKDDMPEKASRITAKLESIEGIAVAISSGQRRNKQIEAKIKKASIPLYLKG